MLFEQVLYAVDAESSAASVGKQDTSLTSLRLAQPGSEYGAGGLGQRCTSFPPAFADHPQVSANPKDKILTGEPRHL
jgi:hypothetical protein